VLTRHTEPKSEVRLLLNRMALEPMLDDVERILAAGRLDEIDLSVADRIGRSAPFATEIIRRASRGRGDTPDKPVDRSGRQGAAASQRRLFLGTTRPAAAQMDYVRRNAAEYRPG
jgi:hypothetical protein